jgi:hypothetical protein
MNWQEFFICTPLPTPGDLMGCGYAGITRITVNHDRKPKRTLSMQESAPLQADGVHQPPEPQ